MSQTGDEDEGEKSNNAEVDEKNKSDGRSTGNKTSKSSASGKLDENSSRLLRKNSSEKRREVQSDELTSDDGLTSDGEEDTDNEGDHFDIYSTPDSQRSPKFSREPFRDPENGSIEYDFEAGSFKWRKNKSENSASEECQSDVPKQAKEKSQSPEQRSRYSDKKSHHPPEQTAQPESVTVFTLASKRLGRDWKKRWREIQPLMDRSHRSHGNRIEDEFFLSKAQLMRW